MKFTLLFSILFFASQSFSQTLINQPFSKQDILIINSQYATQKQQNGARSMFQKLDSSQVRIFNAWSFSWVDGVKTQYEYFSDGSLKTQTSITYQSFTEIMEFNNNGKILYHKWQTWNGTTFKDYINTIYVYDNDGFHQSDTNYEQMANHWVTKGYSENQVNTQGQIQQKINYQIQGAVAIPTQKFSFINDASGNILNLTTFQYLNGQWENHYNYFYSYNSLERTEEFYYQIWDAGSWLNSNKTEYTYLSNNQTLNESYYWDNLTWVIETKQEFQYNTSVSTNAVWLPIGLKQNNQKIIGRQTYYNDNGFWGDIDSTNYFYSEVTPNSIPSISQSSNYKLQKNPVASEINIVNKSGLPSQIKVYSNTGKLVISHSSSSSLIRLDANKLSKGMYFVNIQNANDQFILKVIVSQ